MIDFNSSNEEISAYVKENVGDIEHGMPYNVYECGCVIKNSEDSMRYLSFPPRGVSRRSCPNHDFCRLITKYKLCSCGREYFNKKIGASKTCRKCYYRSNRCRLKEIQRKVRANGGVMPKSKYRNEDMADPARWDCGTRDKCLIDYLDYDAIPCKGCQKYRPKSLNVDPRISSGFAYESRLLNTDI